MKVLCRRGFLLVLSLSLIAISIASSQKSRAAIGTSDTSAGEPFAENPQQTVVAGFDFANLDRNASACQDFNQFASGGWMAKNPVPGAYFEYGGERIKVLAAEIGGLSGAPGTVLDHGLAIACGGGSILPSLVQRAGRGAMTTAELLRGFVIPAGATLA